jgi:uncharacterized protein YjbI with pentapeptide repeats
LEVTFREVRTEIDLSWKDLHGKDLECANLGETLFRDALLHKVKLTSANLQGADLGRANLASADLRFANLKGVDLDGENVFEAVLTGTDLLDSKNLPISTKEAKSRDAIVENSTEII